MFKKLTIILATVLLSGCGLLKSYDENIYHFNYAGDNYEIVSLINRDSVEYNLLQQYDAAGELILQGRDNDSDGKLDAMTMGEMNLSEANDIYFIGIDQAIESGKFDSKNEVRIFEIAEEEYIYVIETFGYDDLISRRRMVYGYISPVTVYNELTIINTTDQSQVILKDTDADGMLSSAPENDDGKITEYQVLYKKLLDLGIDRGRINKVQSMFIVMPL